MGDAMTRLLSITAAALALIICGLAAPAQAQATRTWVSGTGDDANPCSRTAPCKTLAGAISKTAAGGEIDTIDNGAFGAVTINKSIGIIGMGPGQSGVLQTAGSAFIINAGATDVVRIEGFAIEGNGTASQGINFIAGGALHVKNVLIYGFRGPSGNGILFAPSSGNPELYVSDSTIAENGGGQGGGLNVAPTSAAGATAVVENTRFMNNATFAVSANGTNTSGVVQIQASRSVFSGHNAAGAVNAVESNAGGAIVTVTSSTISNNLVAFGASGAGAGTLVSKSLIAQNGTVASGTGGGNVYTNGDNSLFVNGAVGTIISLPLQ